MKRCINPFSLLCACSQTSAHLKLIICASIDMIHSIAMSFVAIAKVFKKKPLLQFITKVMHVCNNSKNAGIYKLPVNSLTYPPPFIAIYLEVCYRQCQQFGFQLSNCVYQLYKERFGYRYGYGQIYRDRARARDRNIHKHIHFILLFYKNIIFTPE